MLTLSETRAQMSADPQHAMLHLMDFVDDFRRHRNPEALAEPFVPSDERVDALAAATAEQLCHEASMEPPEWLLRVPGCKRPWFVSGLQSLKAIALVESPLPFRIRQIFVLANFLHRV